MSGFMRKSQDGGEDVPVWLLSFIVFALVAVIAATLACIATEQWTVLFTITTFLVALLIALAAALNVRRDSEHHYDIVHVISVAPIWVYVADMWRGGCAWHYAPKAVVNFALSLVPTPLALYQRFVLEPRLLALQRADTPPPIFIIGHWRSLTTHLHYMMSEDPQFCFVSTYQAITPTYSLTDALRAAMQRALPPRRPFDDVKYSMDSPQEDEMCIYLREPDLSVYQAFYHQRRYREIWDRLFVQPSARLLERVKAAYRRHVELRYAVEETTPGRTLVLKNPANTMRIRELLELWPRARFVFIHRCPRATLYSTLNLWRRGHNSWHDLSESEMVDAIIYMLNSMLRKYARDKHLIPATQLVEVSAREVQRAPVATLRRIYTELAIPNFDESHFADYLDETYQKNSYVENEDWNHRIDDALAWFSRHHGYQ